MSGAVGKVFVFLLVVLGIYLWIGYAITEMTGGEKPSGGAVEITPDGGETIYWGKGRCYTCHSLGGQGSAVRGPNHGQFGDKFPLPMGSRAVERAKQRTEKTGQPFTATDYMVESMADPGAYVVEGFKNEMAVVFAPPISLSLNEIKAIVAYLMAQGGDLDMEVIDTKPSEITQKFYSKISAASAAGGGDPDNGAVVFEDNCSECHMLQGEGAVTGPDLSNIGAKGVKFISEAILNPAKNIVKGYETVVAEAKDGIKTIGIKTRDEASEIDITKKTGEVVTIARADIKSVTEEKNKSLMPEDMNEALTVKDMQDILAFLIMQKAAQEGGVGK